MLRFDRTKVNNSTNNSPCKLKLKKKMEIGKNSVRQTKEAKWR